jgi:Kef-type K+ transport system membrane component KefB
VKADLPVQLLALVGLAFLLFLAGMEVDLKRLRVLLLRLAGLGIALSFGLAASASYGLRPARMSPPP